MKQLNLFYENVEYAGRIETYYFYSIQKGYPGKLQDILLYNASGELSSTISDSTIEKILNKSD